MTDYRIVSESIVIVLDRDRNMLGTGFFVLPDGFLVTCYHNLSDSKIAHSDEYDCTFYICFEKSEEEFLCELILEKSNYEKDIAVLKVMDQGARFPFVPLGELKFNPGVYNNIFSFAFTSRRHFNKFPIMAKLVGPYSPKTEDGYNNYFVAGEANIGHGSSGAPVYDLKKRIVFGIIRGRFETQNQFLIIPIEDLFINWESLKSENDRVSYHSSEEKRKNELLDQIENIHHLLGYEAEKNVYLTPELSVDLILKYKLPGSDKELKIFVDCIYTENDAVDYDRIFKSINKYKIATSHRKDINFGKIVSNRPFNFGPSSLRESEYIDFQTIDSLFEKIAKTRLYFEALKINFKQNQLDQFYENQIFRFMDDDSEYGYSYFLEWAMSPQPGNSNLIIGEYGTGKTSFCKKFAYDLSLLCQNSEKNRIPIFIELKNFVEGQTLDEFILTYLSKNDLKLNYSHFKSLNEKGLLILIFDGLDEIPLQADTHIFEKYLIEIIKLNTPNSKILLTFRKEFFPLIEKLYIVSHNFNTYEIQYFNEEQIVSVIRNRRRSSKDWDIYERTIFKFNELRKLATRPLFLDKVIHMLHTVDDYVNITISKIYDNYIDVFFAKTDIGKRVVVDSNLAREVLIEIGRFMNRSKVKKIISEAELCQLIEENFSNSLPGNISPKNCAKSILSHTFFTEVIEDKYSFEHIYFNLYFRAFALYDSINKDDQSLFDIPFLSIEIILLIKDMIIEARVIKNVNILYSWLSSGNINVIKYAAILLGFIDEILETIEPRVDKVQYKKKITDGLHNIYGQYKNNKSEEAEHLKKHIQLSFGILGDNSYAIKLSAILKEIDYTHKWYAILALEKLARKGGINPADYKNELKEIIDYKYNKMEIIRIAENILELSQPTQ